MDYNDLYPNDHLMTNPNDYQSQTKLGHMLEDIQFNLQTGLDNVAQNIVTAYDNLKQNINENNNLYDNEVNPIFKLDFTQPWNQNNAVDENQIDPISKLDLTQPWNQNNNLVHEELAEKERRIRELEYAHVEDTKRLTRSENKQLEDRKKIQHLGKEIEKLKKNPFLKWWERATEDSKEERIF